jgi:hypothetical protein
MGWGEKAIEVRSVQTGQLDGVFMHKRVQAFTFLCERNEKVFTVNSYHCCNRKNTAVFCVCSTYFRIWCFLKSARKLSGGKT